MLFNEMYVKSAYLVNYSSYLLKQLKNSYFKRKLFGFLHRETLTSEVHLKQNAVHALHYNLKQ